ncbi:MAG: hypothetical protein GY715_20115 [Planctomycetes bacterium]|nr:hypothetical protein [Planctomycetota bacterium]
MTYRLIPQALARWLTGGAAVLAIALATSVDGGACCYPDGSCVQEDEIECITFHGMYQGDGTLCFGTICPCTADFNGSLTIDFQDVLQILTFWGAPGPTDLDGDGTTGMPDLMLLIGAWGPCV